MNSTKAIFLLNIQIDKLATLNANTYRAWKTQTASYIKDIFGEKTDEYFFIKDFRFIGIYDDPYNQQIKKNTPGVKTFLDNCIESIEHRGLTKKKNENPKEKESWTKKYPLIWEIVKAIIILSVGYFFRFITEPKQTQVGNKINTEQSPNK